MPATFTNLLSRKHEEAGAEFQAYGEMGIVSTFGQPQAEYAAIHKSCGMMDLAHRGVLELTGGDRLSFLNNLLTNQTWNKQSRTGLEPGHGVYAFLLNAKGRIIADMNVLERGDRTWLEMDRRLIEPVRAVLNKYVFTERLTLEERGDALHEVAIYGPGASAVVKAAVSTNVPLLLPLESTSAGIADQEMTLWRDDPTGTPGWHLVGSATGIAGIWTRMLDMFGQGATTGKRLLRAVGWAAFNACRIETGRPIYGIDFDDSVLPAETAQLERAVSFTKGCYIGQEIVARMHARGQLARQMVGIRMESDALPIAGAPVLDEQSTQVGGITSSTLSPVLSNTAICLGMVKKAHIEPGSRVMVPAEGAVRCGTVVALPFVKPSEVPSP